MDRAEAKIQAEELHHNFKEFESVETTQKDVEFFEFIMKILDGDLSSFTTEELLEEIKNRESTVVLENVKDLNRMKIKHIESKIKFLGDMLDGVEFIMSMSTSSETIEKFSLYKECISEIREDYKNIKKFIDKTAVG
ncbi:hypothetical protein [Clostridium baratii]|uniref:hypothetical protein n=1 Tax=Clostridium baratii TaxID=1561 RepID=UPI0030CE6D81